MNTDALQVALYQAMTGNAALVAALSDAWGVPAVFSDVPEVPDPEDNGRFPYVSFGPEVGTPWDTKSDFDTSVSVQIDVWSRAPGYVEIKRIMALIHAVLHHQPLTIAGASHVLTAMETGTTSMDPDGKTRRGLMLFRVIYDAIGAEPPVGDWILAEGEWNDAGVWIDTEEWSDAA